MTTYYIAFFASRDASADQLWAEDDESEMFTSAAEAEANFETRFRPAFHCDEITLDDGTVVYARLCQNA